MRKRRVRRLVGLIVLFLIAELVARYGLGLGEMPLYIENAFYEYILAPNQNVNRFGNNIRTNSLSMRSEEVSDNDKVRILKIGDSIINGGAHVTQDSLSSSRLETRLQAEVDANVRVLNISAASWGPDNAYAYIEQHGDFDTQLMVLVFSSHDWHDNMHHREVVGVHRSWPNEQPTLALTDGFGRYVWPKITQLFSETNEEYEYLVGFDDSQINSGWQQFVDYASANGIELIVYHHAEQSELDAASFNTYGLEMQTWLKRQDLTYLSALDYNFAATDFRDNIHLNEVGQRKLSAILYPYLKAHAARSI